MEYDTHRRDYMKLALVHLGVGAVEAALSGAGRWGVPAPRPCAEAGLTTRLSPRAKRYRGQTCDTWTARMRTLVDIPNDQLRALAELGARSNQPRAALIREAIAEYLVNHRLPPVEDTFGLWGGAAGDGLKSQEQARAEWQ